MFFSQDRRSWPEVKESPKRSGAIEDLLWGKEMFEWSRRAIFPVFGDLAPVSLLFVGILGSVMAYLVCQFWSHSMRNRRTIASKF